MGDLHDIIKKSHISGAPSQLPNNDQVMDLSTLGKDMDPIRVKLNDGSFGKLPQVAVTLLGDQVLKQLVTMIAATTTKMVTQNILGILMQQGIIAAPKKVEECQDPECPDKLPDGKPHCHVEVGK